MCISIICQRLSISPNFDKGMLRDLLLMNCLVLGLNHYDVDIFLKAVISSYDVEVVTLTFQFYNFLQTLFFSIFSLIYFIGYIMPGIKCSNY